MEEYDAIVVHFGELWLKGRNRSTFIKKLRDNIDELLGKNIQIKDERDRFMIYIKGKADNKILLEKLSYIFGISWFAPVLIVKSDLKSIVDSSNKLLSKNDTVKIIAQRSYKKTKFNSYDIVSEFIKKSKQLNFKIDRDSEKNLFINVTKNGTFLYTEKMRGAGGLPVGSSGKAVVLLSGGIDSPVASYYAMKRGLSLTYIHLHAFPNNKKAATSKIAEIKKVLSKYEANQVIYYVPAYVFQSATMNIPKKYELVVFKLFMYKVAEQIAKEIGANVIITGESLGQVASQTVVNMLSSQQGIESLILRPLIGFDKEEIISDARKLGTYELSIKEYPDVCSIRVINPATSANSKIIASLYKECNLDEVTDRTIKLSMHND
jgi:tRNA uracil 4-sulfurtransferase